MTAGPRAGRLRELALLFLRLGATAFGGPAAHIAMFEDEVVRRRAWMSRAEFLDLLGATNLIPGPNSTEMAIHVGHRRAGFAGLLVAGTCFILPASLITLALAWAYVRYGTLPQARQMLRGVEPVLIVVVLQALVALGRTAVRSRALGVLAAVAAAAAFAGLNELAVLFACGLAAVIARRGTLRPGPALLAAAPLGAGAAAPAAFGLVPLFLCFLKIGAVLFGSGYVLLAFLRADLVERWHWLTSAQLLDAVAAGQLTPGPVFSTATFIGYVLGRTRGAVVATVGIFLPAFAFVALSGPLVPRLRRSADAGAFLDGVNVASLALIARVAWQLGRVAIADTPTLLLALVAAVAVFRLRVNTAWLVVAGALAGLLLGRTA